MDKNQFDKIDRNALKRDIKANNRNSLSNQATNLKKTRSINLSDGKAKNLRKTKREGFESKTGSRRVSNPDAGNSGVNMGTGEGGGKKRAKIDQQNGKSKKAGRNNNLKKKSGQGEARRGKDAKKGNANRAGGGARCGKRKGAKC